MPETKLAVMENDLKNLNTKFDDFINEYRLNESKKNTKINELFQKTNDIENVNNDNFVDNMYTKIKKRQNEEQNEFFKHMKNYGWAIAIIYFILQNMGIIDSVGK